MMMRWTLSEREFQEDLEKNALIFGCHSATEDPRKEALGEMPCHLHVARAKWISFPDRREFSKTKKAKLWINLDGMHEWRRRMAPEEQSFPVQQDACRRCLVKYIYQTVYRVHIYRIYFYLTLFTKENCLPCSQAKCQSSDSILASSKESEHLSGTEQVYY